MSNNNPLTIKSFTKRYGDFTGVNSLNLEVEKGEVFGFLGANGAGKSTTIRSILNFIRPSSGSISIFGMDSVKDSVKIKTKVGYLAGDIALYENKKASSVIKYLSTLNEVNNSEYINELVDRFGAILDKPIGKLSKGNKQKIGLILAFMQKPDLLVLDEPTSGLDPLMKNLFYELVLEMKDEGKTVFVSSHDLSEVQKICDRAAFIREGELVEIENIKTNKELSVRKYRISLAKKVDKEIINNINSVIESSINGNSINLTTQGNLDELFKYLSKLGIHSIEEIETSLEDLFIHYYKN